MSYTHGTALWEAQEERNEFDDYTYSEGLKIRARKQPYQRIVKTGEGKEVLSKSIFYVEPTELASSKIKHMDKLDGELVLERYVMMDLFQKPKLYKFITI